MLLDAIMSMSGTARMGVLALLLVAASQYYRQQLASMDRAQFGGQEWIEDTRDGAPLWRKSASSTLGTTAGIAVQHERLYSWRTYCNLLPSLPAGTTRCAHAQALVRAIA